MSFSVASGGSLSPGMGDAKPDDFVLRTDLFLIAKDAIVAAMAHPNLINVAALCALIPAAILPFRQGAGRDVAFWGALGIAIVGAVGWSLSLLSGAWQTGLSTSLWVSIAASLILFGALAARTDAGWRLAPLLMPYLLAMGVLASAVRGGAKPLNPVAPPVWLDLHILISVLTYALLTVAAVASLAVFLQERALKHKKPNRLTRMLPAVLQSETLAGRLLIYSEIVLGLGLISGMTIQFLESGHFLRLDHKTLLSIIAFLLIGALLTGHRVCGVRGRVAARVVLVAYLLLTLAYPGVKFVTQVLH